MITDRKTDVVLGLINRSSLRQSTTDTLYADWIRSLGGLVRSRVRLKAGLQGIDFKTHASFAQRFIHFISKIKMIIPFLPRRSEVR